MKKLHEKNELIFALVWIAVYCASQSLANPLSAAVGIAYLAHALISVLLSIVLLFFVMKNRLMGYYGLCESLSQAKKLLWYLPLLLLASSNLWYGTVLNMSLTATACYLVTMLFVGFLEEVIFRGLLFKAMAKDNMKSAIIVSSVTFGVGHLLNLVNGSGMGLVANLCQVFAAMGIGFLFVIIFYKSGSLVPCILTHSAINMLSAFSNESGMTDTRRIIHSLLIIVIAFVYTLYIAKVLRKKQCRASS